MQLEYNHTCNKCKLVYVTPTLAVPALDNFYDGARPDYSAPLVWKKKTEENILFLYVSLYLTKTPPGTWRLQGPLRSPYGRADAERHSGWRV